MGGGSVRRAHAGLTVRSRIRAVRTPGTAPMTAESATVEPPKHPLHAMTTFELRDYRRQLEGAITFFDKQDPVPPPRDRLQSTLLPVLADTPPVTSLPHPPLLSPHPPPP